MCHLQQQAQYLHQFVLHASLDAVEEVMWSTKELHLKVSSSSSSAWPGAWRCLSACSRQQTSAVVEPGAHPGALRAAQQLDVGACTGDVPLLNRPERVHSLAAGSSDVTAALWQGSLSVYQQRHKVSSLKSSFLLTDLVVPGPAAAAAITAAGLDGGPLQQPVCDCLCHARQHTPAAAA